VKFGSMEPKADNIMSLEWVIIVHDMCSKCARTWMTWETRVAACDRVDGATKNSGGTCGCVEASMGVFSVALDLSTGMTIDSIDRLGQGMAARAKSSSGMW
jgi:hypothetical protein